MGWKSELAKMDLQEAQDLDTIADANSEAKTNDIGIINPTSGAGILARENGLLEGFADHGLGFRFDPSTQRLLVFAPEVHLFTSKIETHSANETATYFTKEAAMVRDLLK